MIALVFQLRQDSINLERRRNSRLENVLPHRQLLNRRGRSTGTLLVCSTRVAQHLSDPQYLGYLLRVRRAICQQILGLLLSHSSDREHQRQRDTMKHISLSHTLPPATAMDKHITPDELTSIPRFLSFEQ